MKFDIEIKCDNAAFGEDASERGTELDCILSGLAKRIGANGVEPGDVFTLKDTNGNTVGHARLLR